MDAERSLDSYGPIDGMFAGNSKIVLPAAPRLSCACSSGRSAGEWLTTRYAILTWPFPSSMIRMPAISIYFASGCVVVTAAEPVAAGLSSAAEGGSAVVSVFEGRTYRYKTAKSARMPTAEPAATSAGDVALRADRRSRSKGRKRLRLVALSAAEEQPVGHTEFALAEFAPVALELAVALETAAAGTVAASRRGLSRWSRHSLAGLHAAVRTVRLGRRYFGSAFLTNPSKHG